MDRTSLERYISEQYNCDGEHPWESAPNYTVFRHGNNRKWFAVFMNIPKSRLGIAEDGNVDILNLKCDPLMLGSLLLEQGFYPAYHMSKTKWITVALDQCGDEEKVRWLIELSFDATATKHRK